MFGLVIFAIIELLLFFFVWIVYARAPEKKANLYFAKLIFTVAMWVIANYLENEFVNIRIATFFLKLDFAIAPIIFYYYFLFCLNFPLSIEINRSRKFRIFAPMGMLSLLSFSDLVIKDIHLTNLGIQFEGSRWFLLYALFLFGYAANGILSLVLKIRRHKGIQRTQIYYVLLGISITTSTALVVNLILSQLFVLSVTISRLGIYGIVALAFIVYAILKYRIMDIKIVLTRAGMFVFVYFLILGIPFGIIGLIKEDISKAVSNLWILSLSLMALLASAGPFIYMKLQRKLEARIRAQEFKTHEALRRLSHNMLRFNELNILLKLIAHYLVKILQIRFAAIYLLESQSNKYFLNSVWQSGEKIELPQEFDSNSALVSYLNLKKLPVVTEESAAQAPAALSAQIKKFYGMLANLNVNTVIPSFLRNGLIAFVVLSDRKNNVPFSQDDLNLLMVLSNEAALAIENARFHQKEVSALLEKSKREALADMASGASHQFNNRLAAISSSVELLLLKLDNFNIEAQQDENTKILLRDAKAALEMIDSEVYKGKEITSAILKRAKAKTEFQQFNLVNLIDNVYKLAMISRSYLGLDNAREVKFKMNSSVTNPNIVASEALLQDVFYNLMDNSYDAIQEKARLIDEGRFQQGGLFDGTIEVILKEDGSSMVIEVKDDGIGLSKDNLRKLFTPYFTTKATSNKGSGLGLCIIRDFIERHKGAISCDSEYGKGTIFTIKLPIRKGIIFVDELDAIIYSIYHV